MSKTCSISSTIIQLTCLCICGCQTTSHISYKQDVYPVFVEKCITCHSPPDGEGYTRSGLDMSSYETLMEGSIFGPAILPGDSQKSPLIILVEGRAGDLSREMERRHKPITDQEINALHLWVEQGAQNN